MAYIAREDGEHFVIPSYRDVLAAKSGAALKKDILQLSQNYGEYITMQRRAALRFEVAFSPDTGYLLGESIWHHFNRPPDMIYCEEIPNTSEAILVIVKSGNVYLDGSFSKDSIPDELVVFLTQENNFEIYVYGDVPISQTPEEGKFAFEEKSVKSFTVLDQPVFQTLPLLKAYQLKPVEVAIKSQGVGGMPLMPVLGSVAFIVFVMILWSYFRGPAVEEVQAPQVNPYQVYIETLNSPAPEKEMKAVLSRIDKAFAMPGWAIEKIEYGRGTLSMKVVTKASTVQAVTNWAEQNESKLSIQQDGIYILTNILLEKRATPRKIYSLKEVVANLIDRLSSVYPGNRLQLAEFKNKGLYQDVDLSIIIEAATPMLLSMIGEQFKDLPIVLETVSLVSENGVFNGKITFKALGS